MGGYYHQSPLITGEALLSLLCSHRNIQRLRTDQTALMAITERLPPLTNLRALQLYHGSTASDANADPSLYAAVSGKLPALKDLDGDLGDSGKSPFWMMFLPIVGSTIVKLAIGLFMEVNCEPEYVMDLFEVIGNSCPSLQSLYLALIRLPDGDDADDIDGVLRPLFACNQLMELVIVIWSICEDIWLTLRNDDIPELAKAWPNIEVLQLYTYREDDSLESEPSLTLTAIAELALGCPKLRDLTITLNAETCPTSIDTSTLLNAHTLQTIDFAGSWIAAPVSVATWLGDLFPSTGISSKAYADDCEHKKRPEMWESVKTVFHLIQEGNDQNIRNGKLWAEVQNLRSHTSRLEEEMSFLREENARLRRDEQGKESR
jgi:hypothetical protein